MTNGTILFNKKIRFENQVLDEYEAGICLVKHETKQIINHNFNFENAFVIFKNNEAFLLELNVAKPENLTNYEYFDSHRTKKLLLHKKQIKDLLKLKQKQKVALLIDKVYVVHGLIKVNIVVCKHKNAADKRQTIKARELSRELNKKYKLK